MIKTTDILDESNECLRCENEEVTFPMTKDDKKLIKVLFFLTFL